MQKKGKKPYLKLFLSTLSLSAFTFGGGYVIVPLMKKKFTESFGWLDEEEMLELVSVAQSSPGAIAVNCATLVGYRMAGLPGALLCVLGTAIPPFAILTLVSFFYGFIRDNVFVAAAMRGMQAGIAAVIADVVLKMAGGVLGKGGLPSFAVMAAAFAASWYWRVNAALIILVCGAAGAVSALVSRHGREG